MNDPWHNESDQFGTWDHNRKRRFPWILAAAFVLGLAATTIFGAPPPP